MKCNIGDVVRVSPFTTIRLTRPVEDLGNVCIMTGFKSYVGVARSYADVHGEYEVWSNPDEWTIERPPLELEIMVSRKGLLNWWIAIKKKLGNSAIGETVEYTEGPFLFRWRAQRAADAAMNFLIELVRKVRQDEWRSKPLKRGETNGKGS